MRKLRRGAGNALYKDVLVADVLQAHAEYSPDHIKAMFEYKGKVMNAVASPPCLGNNDYERHM